MKPTVGLCPPQIHIIHVLSTGMSNTHQHVLTRTYIHMPMATLWKGAGIKDSVVVCGNRICTSQKGETSRIRLRETLEEECLEWRTKDLTINCTGRVHLQQHHSETAELIGVCLLVNGKGKMFSTREMEEAFVTPLLLCLLLARTVNTHTNIK